MLGSCFGRLLLDFLFSLAHLAPPYSGNKPVVWTPVDLSPLPFQYFLFACFVFKLKQKAFKRWHYSRACLIR